LLLKVNCCSYTCCALAFQGKVALAMGVVTAQVPSQHAYRSQRRHAAKLKQDETISQLRLQLTAAQQELQLWSTWWPTFDAEVVQVVPTDMPTIASETLRMDGLLSALRPTAQHSLPNPGASSTCRRALGATELAESLPIVSHPASTGAKTVCTENAPRQIQLQVRDQCGSEVAFNIKSDSPLRKLMDTYCSHLGLKASQVGFTVNGSQVLASDTAEALGLPDGSVIDAARPESLDIGGGVQASSFLLHRYIQISTEEGFLRGHVFDIIPATAPLPEHVCVRFCSGGGRGGRAYQWFTHDGQNHRLADGRGDYNYILEASIVRTSTKVAHVLNHRLGLDEHRHRTQEILRDNLCPLTPQNFEQCLTDLCQGQQHVSTSFLAYGVLRNAGCASSPDWLEHLSCACDIFASVRVAGGHSSVVSDVPAEAPVAVETRPPAFQEADFVRIVGDAALGNGSGYIVGPTRCGRWGVALTTGGCAYVLAESLQAAKRPRKMKEDDVRSMLANIRSSSTAFVSQ